MTTKTKEIHQVHTGLSTDHRMELVQLLNQLLADEQLLYTKTRNYHWNVTGLHFATLHELFEDHYNQIADMGDEIAEQARMLGGTAIGSMAEFLKETRLSETPGTIPLAQDMIANLLGDHEEIISNLRKDIEMCMDEYNDEGTADLLIGVMRSHEKMAWMLRSSISNIS